MSEPSDWPLSGEAVRVLIPNSVLVELEDNALSRDCFPTAFGFYPSAYRHQMQRREHDDYLLMYCVAGTGWISVPGYKTPVHAGDLWILPPGMPHHYAASEQQPWSLFWCHFRGEQADLFYEHIRLQAQKPVVHGISDVGLQTSFHSMLSIARSGYSQEAFIHAANQLRQILTLIERLRKRTMKYQTSESLQQVRDYMREHLSDRLTLDDLARISHLSKYHFTRKYKELTGYPPLQHFEHLKIEQACLMLDSSHVSISEIAFQLGYDDALYFSRVFRKVTGRSPSQYRQSWRE